MIITRLFPPSWSPACAAPSSQTVGRDCSVVEPSGRFVGERQHSSSRTASVAHNRATSCNTDQLAQFVRLPLLPPPQKSQRWRGCRRRRCRSLVCSTALAWATTTIPTVANSPLPWRLPRRHEDFPGFNRPQQPLWPLMLNPQYQLVLVMTIGLMMCLRP